MWIKNIFKKEQKSMTTQQLQGKLQFQPSLPAEFQEQAQMEPSKLFIDSSQDTRYSSLKAYPHGPELGVPLTLLYPSQSVIVLHRNSFNCSSSQKQEHSFKAKSSHDEFFTPLDVLLLTDRQLIISPNIFSKTTFSTGASLLSISLGMVEKCEYVLPKKEPARCVLMMKDQKCLIISSVLGDDVRKLVDEFKRFGHVEGINKFYAFRFGKENQTLVKHPKGWPIYNTRRQFQRQGIQIEPLNQQPRPIEQSPTILSKYAYRYIDNSSFQLSPTYPQLIAVPSRISFSQIIKCSKFRTKERLPVLTYALEFQNKKFSTLFRCSQNKVGMMGSRCRQDQFMMECIGEPIVRSMISTTGANNTNKNCKIYDARGYYAALGNMFAGKGYEKEEYYKNCQIQWLDIPNIHAVRDSYNLLRSSDHATHEFIQTVGNSGWYDYLFLILAGAKNIVKDLLKGINCVVHCSDGWDRTSQLCALSQLLLDPYYRTIEGFAVLVEKDWRGFGHKFRQRTGQYHPTNYHPHQKSPIFVQFLDCIYQIMVQFPLSFQYSDKLLLFLANAVNQNVFGNFMTNSAQQSKVLKVQEVTVSVWAYIIQHRELFLNPFYLKELGKSESYLDISSDVKHIKIWKDHFLGESNDYGGNQIEHEVMKQEAQINRALREQFFNNDETIRAIKRQIKNLKGQQPNNA